jgi:HEPN domain-containing protein
MPPDVRDWLAKARVDLEAARFLCQHPSLPADVAAFHYQQAAEKAIKGILVTQGIVPPHSHDLRALMATMKKPVGLSADAAEALTPFAVLSRYPGFDTSIDKSLLERFDAFALACIERLDELNLQDDA